MPNGDCGPSVRDPSAEEVGQEWNRMVRTIKEQREEIKKLKEVIEKRVAEIEILKNTIKLMK